MESGHRQHERDRSEKAGEPRRRPPAVERLVDPLAQRGHVAQRHPRIEVGHDLTQVLQRGFGTQRRPCMNEDRRHEALRQGQVGKRLCRFRQRAIAHVVDHADHGPIPAAARERENLSDPGAAGPQTLRQGAIDYRDGRRVSVVGSAERPAFQKGNAQRSEIARGDDVPRDLHRGPWSLDRDAQVERAQRGMPPERGRGNCPAAPDLVDQTPIERRLLRRRITRRVDPSQHDVLRDETARNRRDAVGAAQQEPRGDHQDTCHRHLRGHQRLLAPAAARRPGPWGIGQRRWPNRRHQQQPETDRRPGRAGDGQHPDDGPGVQGDRRSQRRQLRQRRHDLSHPPQSQQRHRHPGAHQQKQLGRARTDEGRQRRSQRTAHRQLVRPLGAAGQQQQQHVAAGSEQEDARDGHQDTQEPRRVPVVPGSESGVVHGPRHEPPVLGSCGGHVGRQPIPGQGGQLGGLAARRRRVQPSDRLQPARPRVEQNIGGFRQHLAERRQRNPEVRRVRRTGERVDADADDRERLRPQAHAAPDEVGVLAEPRGPGPVGHDRHRPGARGVVARRQQATARRPRPQHGEEVAGHQGDVHTRRRTAGNEREVELPEGRENESLRARIAQLQILGMTQGREAAVLDPDLQREEPVRVDQVERPPEVPIHRRQHDGGNAERKRQGQYGSHRERAATDQRSQRAVEISRHRRQNNGDRKNVKRPSLMDAHGDAGRV